MEVKMDGLAKRRIGSISRTQPRGEAVMAVAPTPIDSKSLETPAVFANHFQFTVLGGTLARLSFGEAISPHPPIYRTTVLMVAEDARQFAQAILNALSVPAGRAS